jgi:hypothetical protein
MQVVAGDVFYSGLIQLDGRKFLLEGARMAEGVSFRLYNIISTVTEAVVKCNVLHGREVARSCQNVYQL